MKWSILLALAALLNGSPADLPAAGPARPVTRPSQNPAIAAMVARLNRDSLQSVMESMVNLGTRFMYAGNRKAVASWIAGRFRQYGYTNAVLDSFRVPVVNFRTDSVWQYNVVAEITGRSAPGEIYVLSAHHDDFCMPDPYTPPVPGADDNASGCAVALEIARVIKQEGFIPEATIRFVTYAAEELVGYTGFSGSMYHAGKIHAMGEDLRLHLCNDMVAYSEGPGYKLFGVDEQAGKNAWAGELTAFSTSLYSSLEMVPGSYPVSDSYRFWQLGYPVSGFQEYTMSPYYHTRHDSVSHCMTGLCLEAAKANCAILLNELLTPVPQYPLGVSHKNGVEVSWKPTLNANIHHFTIFRSQLPDIAFEAVATVPAGSSSVLDSTAVPGVKYYYRVTSSDGSGNESTPSNTVSGAVATRQRPLLVVKDSQGGYNSPSDSVVNAFYRQVFSGLPGDFSDASVADSLDISVLGKYRQIFWLSNTYSDQPNSSARRHQDDLYSWVRDGGRLFLAGFQPTFMLQGNTRFEKTYSGKDTLFDIFRISRVERKPAACLNGALPSNPDYPVLTVDPAKCLAQIPGHLMNLESLSPAAGASVIYSWTTGYDTLSNQGNMKGKPVGVEYIGPDRKLVLMSVPVFYLDSANARSLVELVYERFKDQVGIGEIPQGMEDPLSVRVYPNPSGDRVTIVCAPMKPGGVSITISAPDGKTLLERTVTSGKAGELRTVVTVGGFPGGTCLLIVRTGKQTVVKKLVISR